jgi:hypothetical protein
MSNADDGRPTTPAVPVSRPSDDGYTPAHAAAAGDESLSDRTDRTERLDTDPVGDRDRVGDGDRVDHADHLDTDRVGEHDRVDRTERVDTDRTGDHDVARAVRPDADRTNGHDVDRADRHEVDHSPLTRQEIVGRQKEEFGGFKFGSAFFGWLTATGTAVILTAILGAIGAGVGLGIAGGNTSKAGHDATSNAGTVGLIGAIALAVILFVAYYCGGYVAGRMARFDGVKQGLAVWFWAVAIAIIAAIVVAIAGTQADFLGQVNAFPRIPVDEGNLTVTGIVTVVVALVLSLVGAILGGLAGMHFHRKVDRVGLERPVS